MIFEAPTPDDALDQGDLIDGCPVVRVTEFVADQPDARKVALDFHRVILLTQTCDLTNQKTDIGTVASVFDAQHLIDLNLLKPADVKGPLRAGRIWGMYFLPASTEHGLGEMIVDLRRLHTVRLDLLLGLARAGGRRGRLQTPYREHLAKHFADTFSRIGLPQPYETM
jgi:hypothetical protein